MSESRPGILVSVADSPARGAVVEQLRRRYGDDYEILDVPDQQATRERLAALKGAGGEVALMIARQAAAEAEEGLDPLFVHARILFPDVRRTLLIDWGSWASVEIAETVSELMARTMVDYYLVAPSREPDESFHRAVTDLLHDWERASGRAQAGFTVIGDPAVPRTHALRILLARGGVGAETISPDSERGRALLAGDQAGSGVGAGADADAETSVSLPAVRLPDGRILPDPDDPTLASSYGLTTELPDDPVDLVIVGAGPGGLAAAVYAASEGLRTLVLEAESIGGQAGSSSLIRNYLGFPRGISGADLAQRAYQQAWAFGARFAHARRATGLSVTDGGFSVEVGPGARVQCGAVVLANGVSYRRLAVPSLEPFVGVSVFYGATSVEAKAQEGKAVYVIGGGNSAGQAALHLSRYAASVSLVVRGASLAESMSQYLIEELSAAGVAIVTQSRVVGAEAAQPPDDPLLERIVLSNTVDGSVSTVACEALFITIGARPHTEWLPPEILRDKWGSVITGREVVIEGGRRAWSRDEPPAPLESSVPGFYAVGDVRRGSVKRVASAVGEGSVVISSVHQHLAGR
jgi:thioredoxin reductase (NADPH)